MTTQDPNQNVLNLLRMVAPERGPEFDALWDKYKPEFVEAGDRPGFVMQTIFGAVQYSNLTLLQIWLYGWVLWREMYSWSTFIWDLSNHNQPFVLAEFNKIPGQAASYASADALHSQALAFAKSDPTDWAMWPSDVPKPLEIELGSKEDWLIKDFAHHAVALFLLHELRHIVLAEDGHDFLSILDEEFECDRWAMDQVIAASDEYAKGSGEDPVLVKGKRAMGVALGMAVIAHVQEIGLWESRDHPSLASRFARLVEGVELTGNDHLWNVSCSFLLACMRRENKIPERVEFTDQRDLLRKLLAGAA